MEYRKIRPLFLPPAFRSSLDVPRTHDAIKMIGPRTLVPLYSARHHAPRWRANPVRGPWAGPVHRLRTVRRRERYAVESLRRQHGGDVKMPDLLAALVADWPKTRAFSVYDRCKAAYDKASRFSGT
jgi:hypothetical protein